MNKLPVLSAKDFYDLLLRYGCIPIGSNGSHFKLENPSSGSRATIPIHATKDISRGFMKSIIAQLGIDIEDLVKFT
jgi:predicted RNA binding protein YcfA (HicA-like mRNA interferase family)